MKRIKIITLLFTSIIIIMFTSIVINNSIIYADVIYLSVTEKTLKVSKSFILKLNNANNVKWSTSNKKIATVTKAGFNAIRIPITWSKFCYI